MDYFELLLSTNFFFELAQNFFHFGFQNITKEENLSPENRIRLRLWLFTVKGINHDH